MKFVSNLKSMQNVGFEQTQNLLRFLFYKNNLFIRKKTVMEAISCALFWPTSNKYIYKI